MTDSTRLWGCGTALATPFTMDGALDERTLGDFVEWQIGEGVHFVIPCGSTGEAATMSLDEQVRVVRITAERAAGRVPVIAGAGSNDTRRAVELSRTMRDAGATHLLHVSPMYNKPPQRGLLAHFRAVAEATDVPVILYNVPGRTAGNIEAATTLALAEHQNIVAIKEASGRLEQVQDILRHRPDGFSVLSGDDLLTLPMMAMGADGVISVVSNATPRAMSQLVDRAHAGDWDGARQVHDTLVPWMTAAFLESNPIPLKAALAMMGRMQHVLRLPLVPLDARHSATVREALRAAGVTGL